MVLTNVEPGLTNWKFAGRLQEHIQDLRGVVESSPSAEGMTDSGDHSSWGKRVHFSCATPALLQPRGPALGLLQISRGK